MNLLNEPFRENVCTLYVLHIRDSGKLLSTQFVKVDKASSPVTSSILKVGETLNCAPS